jgi:DNA-directed RNA polymerase subunit RPC12/RpoP
MAYWFKCQYCGQWSVSAAHLANLKDKSCPYCGKELLEDNNQNQADKPKEVKETKI